MGTIQTWNEVEQSVAVRKIDAGAVRKKRTDIPNGDYKQVVATAVPVITYNDEMQTIPQISGKIRKEKEVISGVTKANVKFEVEMGSGYMNANEELIEASLGLIQTYDANGVGKKVSFDGSDAAFSNNNKTLTITNVGISSSDSMIDTANGEDAQFVRFLDLDLNTVMDLGYVISETIIAGTKVIYNFANPIDADFVNNFNAAHSYEMKALLEINLDKAPDEALDVLVFKGQPLSKWENNPAFMGIYGGDAIFKGSNAKGKAEIKTEIGKHYGLIMDLEATLYDNIKPNASRLPQEIFYSDTASTNAGTIYWEVKAQDSFSLSGSVVDAGTTAFDTVMGAIKTDIDSAIAGSSTAHNLTVTVVSGYGLRFESTDDAYQEVVITSVPTVSGSRVLGTPTYTFLEQDVWEELSESTVVRPQTPTIDESHIGSNYESVLVDMSGLNAQAFYNDGDIVTLVVNGITHRVVVPSGMTPSDAGKDIADLLAASVELVKDTYGVTATAVAGALTLTAMTPDITIFTDLYIEDGGHTTSMADAITVTKTVENDADALPIANKNFILKHLYLGDFDEDIISFCNTSTLKINYDRVSRDIPCLSRVNGIAGTNNTEYSITLEMELTDQDAVNRYLHWKMYRDNEETSIVGIDVESGFAFLGRKVIVKFEEVVLDGLLGHKLTLNVNYDPNTRFRLSLPQFLN